MYCRLLILVSLLLCLIPALLAQDITGARADYRALAEHLDGLARALAARQAGDTARGPAGEYVLRFDEGADRDEMQLTLRRSAGAWQTAFATVQGWEQCTMREYRGFFLSNGIASDWRPSNRYAVATDGLQVDGARLSGPMTVRYKYDWTVNDRLPPGVLGAWRDWWSTFIPGTNNIPRVQTYQVDARVMPDVYRFDVLLDGGVNWQGKDKDGKPTVNRQPVCVQFQAPGTRFTPVTAQTPTWCGGWHVGDTTGLRFADGRLTGTMVVLFNQDGWTPFGGKTWQHPPITVKYELDARLRGNTLTGAYKGTGDMGEFTGEVRGIGGQAVFGKYQGKGELGEQVGPINGMLLSEPALKQTPYPPLSVDDTTALQQMAAWANNYMEDIRAYSLALQAYPLSVAEARRQSSVAAPVWDPAKLDAAQIAAYLREARAAIAALPAPGAAAPAFETVRDGLNRPTLGAAPTALAADGANVLPDDPSGWSFIKEWQILGPFEQRAGIEHDAALPVELIPVAGLGYRQTTDRFGCSRAGAPTTWQAQACTSQVLAAPWDTSGWFTGFTGQVWYATAVLQSPAARNYWFSLETGDQAKLWVNGALVWSDAERTYRNRAWGPTLVRVPLRAGANRLVLRVHRDRRTSWARVALTGGDIQQKPLKQEPADNSNGFVFPTATPPLAWDIDKGINVAWRRDDLGGGTRPAALGDAILLGVAPQTLYCLDGRTGATRWSGEVNALALADPNADAAWAAADAAGRLKLLQGKAKELGLASFRALDDLRPSAPIAGAGRAYLHAGTGAAACFDADGKRQWLQRTNLTRAKLYLCGTRLLIEGAPSALWTFPKELEPVKAAKGAQFTGVLALDAASGKELGRWTIPASFDDGAGRLIVARANGLESAALLTGCSYLVEFLTDRPAVPLDAQLPGPDDGAYHAGMQIIGSKPGRPFGVSANSTSLFMTAQEEGVGVRFWPMPGGRVAYQHIWQSNYEQTAFGSFQGPCVATEEYVFTWHPVNNRGPHCPDPREEVNCLDARTGQHISRLKPAIASGVNHYVTPVIAGGYLFVIDAGGGSHGGNPTYSQVAVITADARLQVICRNNLNIGNSQAPVFAGDRLFTRSGAGLVCIAVTTPEGRAYQVQRLAATALEELGPKPTPPAAKDIAPSDTPIDPAIPVDKLRDGRPTEFWLGAGPFPAAGDDAALAALRPRAGAESTIGGKAMAFTPLTRENAYSDPPEYRRTAQLQGTGDILPWFFTWLTPSGCATPAGGVGVFYTVVENTRDRFVIPMTNVAGVTQWLGGQKLEADAPVHLAPGRYPFVVRVEPAFFAFRAAQPKPTATLPPGVLEPPYPDYRLNLSFRELPHPPTRLATWVAKAAEREDRLQAAIRDLPGSDEAKGAAEALAAVRAGK